LTIGPSAQKDTGQRHQGRAENFERNLGSGSKPVDAIRRFENETNNGTSMSTGWEGEEAILIVVGQLVVASAVRANTEGSAWREKEMIVRYSSEIALCISFRSLLRKQCKCKMVSSCSQKERTSYRNRSKRGTNGSRGISVH
jgi:hypothetical protein